MCLDKDVNIKIFVEANCSEPLEQVKEINNANNGPYAFKTVLGWCIVGPVKSNQAKRKFCCNRATVMEAGTNEFANIILKKE